MAHYYKRSTVETVFSMIRAMFGGRLRSKQPAAQINEALVKMLRHSVRADSRDVRPGVPTDSCIRNAS